MKIVLYRDATPAACENAVKDIRGVLDDKPYSVFQVLRALEKVEEQYKQMSEEYQREVSIKELTGFQNDS